MYKKERQQAAVVIVSYEREEGPAAVEHAAVVPAVVDVLLQRNKEQGQLGEVEPVSQKLETQQPGLISFPVFHQLKNSPTYDIL